jgi:hypothetical protein
MNPSTTAVARRAAKKGPFAYFGARDSRPQLREAASRERRAVSRVPDATRGVG